MIRGGKKKGKESDEEQEEEMDEIEIGDGKPKEKELTEVEKEALELANIPTIPDSEVSPAAYIFQNQEDRDDL